MDDSENIVGIQNAKKLLEDIPNKIVTALGFAAQGVAQGVAQELTDTQMQILELIQNNPKISRSEIAEQIGKSVKTIERRLAEMENIVKFIGSGYSGHWEIIPAGDMEKQQND